MILVPSLSPPLRFALAALVFLPVVMALWWFLAKGYLLAWIEPAVRLAMTWLMADKVIGLTAQDNLWIVKTSLIPTTHPLSFTAISIFPTRFTVVFPLFWALVLATPGARIRQIVLGSGFLYLVVVLMLLLFIQFKLALYINHQAMLTETPPSFYVLALPYPDYLYYLMGIGRQLSLLVLPTLAPLLIWGVLNRRFIRIIILESVLTRIKAPSFPAPGARGS